MEKPSRIREGSDRALRRLFGHPEVLADLLRAFVPVPALVGFDRDSLRQLPDDRVDSGLNRRQSDATWSFELAGGAPMVLLFEAQSREDRAMAGRMAVQAAMFCENFQRTRPGEAVPEVLPVVLYTGQKRWGAARSLSAAAPGRAEERAKGLARDKGLLRGLILRKFGDETAEKWLRRVSALDDHDRLRELSGMVIDCETGEELLRRL